jgi:hypothetical protein
VIGCTKSRLFGKRAIEEVIADHLLLSLVKPAFDVLINRLMGAVEAWDAASALAPVSELVMVSVSK